VMSADPERLAARYGALATVVHRAGRAYPAAYEHRTTLRVALRDAPLPIDPALLDGGAAHLAAVRERVPWMYDGTVVGMERIDAEHVVCTPSSYFDRIATGDALRAEDGDALRDRADELALGDPLRLGTGRAAGFGVTTVATLLGEDGGRVLVMGRRVGLPVEPGAWHVVPAGMAEPHDGAADPFLATALVELEEELGVTGADPAGVRLLGLGWDLLRLMPDVVYRVDLDLDAADVLARAPREEHGELKAVPVTPEGLAAFWATHEPREVAAPGAAALALLDETL
jgi:8-oxo-dGTP pyrophosphatase MutT (NUDIX family)